MSNKKYNIMCDKILSLNEHERRQVLTMLEDMQKASIESPHSIIDIALVKSYAYCEEYNTATGRTEERNGARFLKQGFTDGFLAGFAHRMGGGHD